LPGLAQAAAANLARQQDRVRLFEIGRSYHGNAAEPVEVLRIAGFAAGPRMAEQWGSPADKVDFFDIKADVEALLSLTGQPDAFVFEPGTHAALQPGQTASVMRDGIAVGILGKLHPAVAKKLGLKSVAYLFELDLAASFATEAPSARAISRFPAIRRDIAVVVDESVPAAALTSVVSKAAPDLIKRVHVFDIYTGKGVEAGRKSVAIGLILQETSRTLTDEDADSATARAVQRLQQEYAAELRD
jgi:phenylalanyl-tRNA synthetase beta chain